MATHQGSAAAIKAKTRYELWQETIDGARKDARWNEYDCDIQLIVAQYNRHLLATAGFIPLDWRLIKAMVWTESGGPANRAWRSNPIQIGNPGDPGLRALLSDKEGGTLIIPDEYKGKLTIATVASTPRMNICAGVGYLLMRLASYAIDTVPDERDKKTYAVAVKAGDSVDRIARANSTTIDNARKLEYCLAVMRSAALAERKCAA